MGRSAEAASEFRKAIDLNPGYIDAYANWGRFLATQGAVDQAVSLWTEALTIASRNVYVYMEWGNAHLDRMEFEEALDKFRHAIRLNPRAPGLRTQLADLYADWGRVLAGKGRISEAINKWTAALHIHPQRASVYYTLWGDALFQQEAYEPAIAKYQKGLEFSPHDDEIHNKMKQAKEKLGQLVSAPSIESASGSSSTR